MKRKMKNRAQKWSRSIRKRTGSLKLFLKPRPQPNEGLNKCIIVASTGRSGSTLTYKTVCNAMLECDPSTKYRFTFVSRLSGLKFPVPFVYKTHDFPDELSRKPDNVCVLFCFGSTKDSTISVYSAMERLGAEWIDKHFFNLQATGTFDELFEKDVLQQARQIREWTTFEDVPVLCVHYDAIWKHKKKISKFIGMNFEPPERKEREPKNLSDDLMAAASKVYDPIDRVVEELPKIFIASKKYSKIVAKLP